MHSYQLHATTTIRNPCYAYKLDGSVKHLTTVQTPHSQGGKNVNSIVHEAQSSHSHLHLRRQNTQLTTSKPSSGSCPSSILLSRACCKLCLRHVPKHSRCTFWPHWARHHTASSGQQIGSRHMQQFSVIGFLLTER